MSRSSESPSAPAARVAEAAPAAKPEERPAVLRVRRTGAPAASRALDEPDRASARGGRRPTRPAPTRSPIRSPAASHAASRAATATSAAAGPVDHETPGALSDDVAGGGTALQRCVRDELRRHFELLDGEPPADLYRLVMQQVEASLIETVLQACGGNRSRAALWLGIGRGTLRGKLAEHDRE